MVTSGYQSLKVDLSPENIERINRLYMLKKEIRKELEETPGMRYRQFMHYANIVTRSAFVSFFCYSPATIAWTTVTAAVVDPSSLSGHESIKVIIGLWAILGAWFMALQGAVAIAKGEDENTPLDRATNHVLNLRESGHLNDRD